ncbi:hypothetical protein Btru_045270 [Bulinus truncatus]|nr:hypothetical protein Btru_045270 [Bulinus truncatus]
MAFQFVCFIIIGIVLAETLQEKPFECFLPSETGRCRARQIKFYYDVHSKSCAKFIYGGCRGNPNRFDTLTECRKKCM